MHSFTLPDSSAAAKLAAVCPKDVGGRSNGTSFVRVKAGPGGYELTATDGARLVVAREGDPGDAPAALVRGTDFAGALKGAKAGTEVTVGDDTVTFARPGVSLTAPRPAGVQFPPVDTVLGDLPQPVTTVRMDVKALRDVLTAAEAYGDGSAVDVAVYEPNRFSLGFRVTPAVSRGAEFTGFVCRVPEAGA